MFNFHFDSSKIIFKSFINFLFIYLHFRLFYITFVKRLLYLEQYFFSILLIMFQNSIFRFFRLIKLTLLIKLFNLQYFWLKLHELRNFFILFGFHFYESFYFYLQFSTVCYKFVIKAFFKILCFLFFKSLCLVSILMFSLYFI